MLTIASWYESSGISFGGGVLLGIGRVDPVDVGGLEDHFGFDLERAKHAGRVGREKRVAGAAGEDDEPPFLQVARGATTDVRLGDRFHADRGHDPGIDADALQHVLEREGVDHRRQHAHVVGGDPVESLAAGRGAADDVPAADDQAEPDAQRMDRLDLLGERLDDPEIQAHALLAAQRLAGELEQGAGVGEGHQDSPILNRANRRTCTASPTLPETSLINCPTVLVVVLHVRLLGERPLGHELLELALDDLGADVLRLPLRGDLLLGDPPLPLQHVAGDVLRRHADRVGRRDVQRDVARPRSTVGAGN